MPGVDDGARDEDETLAMARLAAADGVTGMATTVHSAEALDLGLTSAALARRAEGLQSWLRARAVELAIYPGCEVFADFESLKHVKEGRLATLNGTRYVLIEAPMSYLPPYFDRLLFDFQAAGYVPIVAHPERNAGVAGEPGKLRAWASRGILSQLTAGSLLGSHGRRAQQVSSMALQRRWIHLVASDAHGPVVRPPLMAKARAGVTALVGSAEAERLFDTTPMAIVRDQDVEIPAPGDVAPRATRWFGLHRDRAE